MPVTDEADERIKDYARRVANLVCTKEFGMLRKELERVYRRSGVPEASAQAFQDALYATLAQEEKRTGDYLRQG